MQRVMKVGPRGVTCWPEGTDAFGPSLAPGAEVAVEYHGERVVHPLSLKEFYIVAFEDKGKVRRFEVCADEVELR